MIEPSGRSEGLFLTRSPPNAACSLTTLYSSAVNLPGFERISTGIPSLPISWRRPALRTRSICLLLNPSTRAVSAANSLTCFECPTVNVSRWSMISDRVVNRPSLRSKISLEWRFRIWFFSLNSMTIWRVRSINCFWLIRRKIMGAAMRTSPKIGSTR